VTTLGIQHRSNADDVQPDRRLSSRPGVHKYLLALAIDWGWIALAMGLAIHVAPHWLTVPLALFIIGTRQHAIAVLAHDAAHFRYHPNKRINDLLGNAFSLWPIGLTIEGYRGFHLEHHKHNGKHHEDPEFQIRRGWYYRLPTGPAKFCGMFATDLAGFGLPELIKVSWAVRPRRWRDGLGLLLFWAGVLTVCAAVGAWMYLLLWFVALCTTFYAVFRVRAWSEHQGIDGTHRFHAGPLLRFVFWPHHTYCHYEHHRWPAIPCFNLPAARQRDESVPIYSVWKMIRFFGGERDAIAGQTVASDYPREARLDTGAP
jgi:fatty acid desaturase